MHVGESYPASGLSGEITPLLLLCGVSAWSLKQGDYTMLLELFGQRRKKGTACSLLLPMWCLRLAGIHPLHGCPGGFIQAYPPGVQL